MMKQLYIFLFLSAIAMADDTDVEGVLRAGSNKFTSNFFSEVTRLCSKQSIVVSAFSVMTPLALLGFAAVGQTHDELFNAMGLPNDNVTKAVFSLMDTRLKSIQGVELKTANKIYIPLDYELNPEFAAVSREVFSSEVENVDFTKNVKTAKEINAWVEDQTNHRIKDLVAPDSIDANTRAIIVNALYFKGKWLTQFGKTSTRPKDFYVTKEKVVQVDMMYNKGDYKYAESEKLKSKILEMPYVGEQSSMVIVLPNEIDGIQELLGKLDLSELDENLFELEEVEVSIPKFKIETTTDLKQILQGINIKRLFEAGQANLVKLLNVNEDLYVSSATQKVFIEVNEEGAEAAATNEFGISYLSAVITNKEYHFVADHPFLFFLKERNNILFSGVYYA